MTFLPLWTHAHAHTYVHTHARTYARTHTHTYTHTHGHTFTHTRKHTHTHTHTRTHKHTRVRAYTHALAVFRNSWVLWVNDEFGISFLHTKCRQINRAFRAVNYCRPYIIRSIFAMCRPVWDHSVHPLNGIISAAGVMNYLL